MPQKVVIYIYIPEQIRIKNLIGDGDQRISVGDQRVSDGDRAISDADLVFNHYYFNFSSRLKTFSTLYEEIIILLPKDTKKQVVARVARHFKALATVLVMIYNELKACCKSGKEISNIPEKKR